MVQHYDSLQRDARGLATPVDRRSLLSFAGSAAAMLFTGACGGGGGGGASASAPVTVVPAGSAPVTSIVASPTPTPTPTPAPAARPVFGANCYDLFYRPYWAGGAATYDPGVRLRQLRDAGVSLVRFSASVFWPNDWNGYDAAPERYLGALDKVFVAAEAAGVQLVPSVLWFPAAVSDHLGESYSAWGNPASRTRAFLDSYVPQVVRRYSGSRALAMWEFSNEMNSFADRANGEQFFPPVKPEKGTPAKRVVADRITAADVRSAYARFAELVRSTGDTHPIGTGSNLPRARQVNAGLGRNDLDTTAQLAEAMDMCLVGANNVLSVHLYPDSIQDRLRPEGSSYRELLGIARTVADKRGAKLFVGEFGVPRSTDASADRATFTAMIEAMKDARVDHAAFWNYDYFATDDWDVTTGNDRSWILDVIRAAA